MSIFSRAKGNGADRFPNYGLLEMAVDRAE
jgi:hypothetical protein